MYDHCQADRGDEETKKSDRERTKWIALTQKIKKVVVLREL